MNNAKIIVEKISKSDIEDIKSIRDIGNIDTAKNILRQIRKDECYALADRACWYDGLSIEEKKEIQKWRKQWLDVTDTFVIPVKPFWIK